MVLFTDEDSVM